jgi:hypothetical protein
MERKSSGYSVSVQWNIASDGTTNYHKEVIYQPDEDTEIINCEKSDSLEGTLHDLTDKELNEILAELEYEKTNDAVDNFPLKSIRISARQ